MKILIGLFFFIAFVVTQRPLPIHQLRIPEGLKLEILARVPNARQMALSPSGIIFVGSREGNFLKN